MQKKNPVVQLKFYVVTYVIKKGLKNLKFAVQRFLQTELFVNNKKNQIKFFDILHL
jgi:hypothetical protein